MFNAKGRLVAVATAGALILSGYVATFAPATAANKKIIIWTDESRGPVMRTLLTGKVPVKGYTIEVKVYSSLEALDTAWNSASAASGPDVIISNSGLVASGGKSGKLVPISIPSSVKSEFSKGALSALSYKGKTYGIPLDVNTTAMFWNTSLFGKKAPKTLVQMVNYFLKNKASKGLTGGFCAADGTWGAHPVYTALGGGAFGYKKNGTPNPKVTLFNSKAFKDNIKKYLLESNGKTNNFLKIGDCIADFKAGKIPFMNTGGWNVDGVNASGVKYKMGSVPGMKKGSFGIPWAGFQGAYLTRFAKDHGVASAANQFLINFMADSTTQAQLSVFGNRPPANLLAAKKVNNPVLAAIARAGSNGVLELNVFLNESSQGASWWDLSSDAFSKIFDGEDVDATLNAAAAILVKNFTAGAANL